ncbi:MAG: endonuclease/exonuclease/phosphatase family protein [Ruminococcaceae bacterium]|nr:endonuclease/exonuclease/phosphatase family protein [Oscillospiraceae bacterium]
MKFKVMTFNLRSEWKDEGKYSFPFRRDAMCTFLKREKPDIVGCQESVPLIRRYLAENLPEYEFLAVDANEKLRNDVAIAYRRDKFDLFGLEQFWVSPTPNIPYSRYPDQAPFPRMATLATLVCRENGQPVVMLNSHLDHISENARVEGAKLLAARLSQYANIPAFLTGDFNAYPGTPAIEAVLAHPELQELTAPLGADVATYHGYGKVTENCKIDYIFATRAVTPVPNTLMIHNDRNEEGINISDHYPISITVET